MRVTLGTRVHYLDGALGELADVVIDPHALRLTQLVVEPHGRHGEARLVPVERASFDGDAIRLDVTLEQANELATVQEFGYLRLGEQTLVEPGWDIGIETVLAIPFSGGYGTFGRGGTTELEQPCAITYDRVPAGHVEIRRRSQVWSVDGEHLGHVDALLVEPDGTLTQLVLERGHLWGRRDVAIPAAAIERVATDTVRLRLAEREVGDLPDVRPAGRAA